MPKAMVIDLSHHNVVPESLQPAADSGIVGVIHKLTEGSSFVDSDVQARRHLAREAGLLWGVYHFMHPGNVQKQVEFFVATASELEVCDEHTLWVCDWEDIKDKGRATLEEAVEFCDALEEATGRVPVLYSGHVLKEAIGEDSDPDLADRIRQFPLWLCHYGVDKPVLPDGYDEYWLWQYSETGTCPGVKAPVDLNQYNGTAEQLHAEWIGEPAAGVGELPPVGDEPAVLITVQTRGIKRENVRVVIEEEEEED